MIQKIIKIKNINAGNDSSDLEYWLKKSAKDRVEAVDFLRKQHDGDTARLQRVVKVIQRTSS